MNLLTKNGKQLIFKIIVVQLFFKICVMQSDMKMQDATNFETAYTHACECMYGMYYARWHEKTME